MDTKTFLSSHFPGFAKKWKKFHSKFKHANAWYIASDYCLDDKNKPNDVMVFTLFPFENPYVLKEKIKQHMSKDIKDFKNISDQAVNYIKESPYFFSIAFIINNKNNFFRLDMNKQILDLNIKRMENWPCHKKEEFIHKIKKLRNYLDRKDINLKLLSDMCITAHIVSFIIEFLLIKTNTKRVFWITDRDKITEFQEGVIHELIRLGYSNLLRNRIKDSKVYGILDDKKYRHEIYDELVRIPDYICGSIASMNFNNINNTSEKHYILFNQGIYNNDRICIMHFEHGKSIDSLDELKIMRE